MWRTPGVEGEGPMIPKTCCGVYYILYMLSTKYLVPTFSQTMPRYLLPSGTMYLVHTFPQTMPSHGIVRFPYASKRMLLF